MEVVSKVKVYSAPRIGTSAYESSYYAQKDGLEKIRTRSLDIGDDMFGDKQLAFSTDNGQTWPEQHPVDPPKQVEGGMLREAFCAYFIDPVNGRQLITSLEGVFKTEDSSEGFRVYGLKYRTSADGGRTALAEERAVQRGYTVDHPFPDIWIGRNCFMNPGPHSILRMPQGHLVMAICRSVLGPDGDLYSASGSIAWLGWLEVLIIIGQWQDDGKIDWRAGPVVSLTVDKSTLGIFEPTLALLPDGRLLMVMRASNGGPLDREGKIPSHKWFSVSSDGGFTWTYPEPWRYTNGTKFWSSSSISQFLPHSNGKLYWIGNINETNPNGHQAREKLFIGEVDQKSMMLKQESLFIAAQRGPGEPPTQLSNFTAHEDRVTHEIILHLPWFVEQNERQWGADSWVYRIKV